MNGLAAMPPKICPSPFDQLRANGKLIKRLSLSKCHSGQPLEIRAGDGRLIIEVASTPVRLLKHGKGVVAFADDSLPVLTAEQVRDALERVRR